MRRNEDRFDAIEPSRRRGFARAGSIVVRVAIFAAAIWALRRELRELHASGVRAAVVSYGVGHLAVAGALVVASFTVLIAIEWLALRYAGPEEITAVPVGAILRTGLVANAFSQSLGLAVVTGTAVRARSYGRYGLDASAIARVSIFVTVTATLGFLGATATALVLGSPTLSIVSRTVNARAAAAVLAIPFIAYMTWAVVRARGRERSGSASRAWVPALQAILPAADLLIMGGVLLAFLSATHAIDGLALMRIYVIAQSAAVISHVPGGAGVFEATLLTLLPHNLVAAQGAQIAAALVMFRLSYYLVPLLIAIPIWLWMGKPQLR